MPFLPVTQSAIMSGTTPSEFMFILKYGCVTLIRFFETQCMLFSPVAPAVIQCVVSLMRLDEREAHVNKARKGELSITFIIVLVAQRSDCSLLIKTSKVTSVLGVLDTFSLLFGRLKDSHFRCIER